MFSAGHHVLPWSLLRRAELALVLNCLHLQLLVIRCWKLSRTLCAYVLQFAASTLSLKPRISPVMNRLMPWFLVIPYLQKLGPPRFRELLADLAARFLPDENLGKFRDIVHNIEDTSQHIYRDSKIAYQADSQDSSLDDGGEPKNMMRLLRECLRS